MPGDRRLMVSRDEEEVPMSGVAEPFVVRPGQSRVDGAILPFKASAADTGGQLSVCEFKLGPWEQGPVLHKHDETDEGFYVIAGVLEAQLGEQRVQADAGSFVWVPRGIPHAFANAGPDELHVLSLVLPGGIEALFAEQATYFSNLDGPPDPVALDEMGRRHGAHTLGPPIVAEGAPEAPSESRYGV